jgi:hypothetical protein
VTMRPLTEDETGDMLLNPCYAIVLSESVFDDHQLEGAKEDWVLKNAQLLREMAWKDWLEQVLVALSTEPQESPTYTVISPCKVIIFPDRLRGDHRLVTAEMWVQANVKALQELGAEKWLWKFLEVLETGGPQTI